MTQIYEKWYPTDIFSDQNLLSTGKRGRLSARAHLPNSQGVQNSLEDEKSRQYTLNHFMHKAARVYGTIIFAGKKKKNLFLSFQ